MCRCVRVGINTFRARVRSQEGWRDEAEAEKIGRRAMMGKDGLLPEARWEPLCTVTKPRLQSPSLRREG